MVRLVYLGSCGGRKSTGDDLPPLTGDGRATEHSKETNAHGADRRPLLSPLRARQTGRSVESPVGIRRAARVSKRSESENAPIDVPIPSASRLIAEMTV